MEEKGEKVIPMKERKRCSSGSSRAVFFLLFFFFLKKKKKTSLLFSCFARKWKACSRLAIAY
jgi:hypothetical protein